MKLDARWKEGRKYETHASGFPNAVCHGREGGSCRSEKTGGCGEVRNGDYKLKGEGRLKGTD